MRPQNRELVNGLPPQTRRQVAILRERFGEMLNYAGRVKRRMERLGFPPNDAFYRETCRAADALQGLFMAAHYASCKTGVARPPKE
jgi:hypothetical protein